MQNKTKIFLILTLIFIFVFISCKDKDSVNIALDYASTNRTELIKVLSHYEGDSLKYKAARFLIDNMIHHYSFTSERLRKYYKIIDSINVRKTDYDRCLILYDSIREELGHPDGGLMKIEDIKYIKADYLIQNIDHAFRMWKEGYWASHLSFDEFCEYLLPYRVGSENIEEWRHELENKYLETIEWIKSRDDMRNSSYWAALYLNDQLKKRGFHLHEALPGSSVDLPMTVLRNMQMGSCKDYVRYATYVMRACGIPVGVDFTPQWPFRSPSHYWNILLENRGKNKPFVGGESNPGYPNKDDYKMAKVYRCTFGYQEQSLYAQKGNDTIPQTLDSPFIKDVSDEYMKGVDISLKLKSTGKKKPRFAYLSVFDNQYWIAVTWSKFNNGNVLFSCMGKDIVYLPSFYEHNEMLPATYPLQVKANGTQTFLIPDMENLDTLILKRKFPVFNGVLRYSERLKGGYFEASNSPLFHHSVRSDKIRRVPQMCWDSLSVSIKDAYRYWRYVSPEKSYCNIAEIEFFSSGKLLNVSNCKILNDGKMASKSQLNTPFDRDPLTYYESSEPSSSWIGIDFGSPVAIEQIKYLPRNDDNNIIAGHLYELFYFGKNGPCSLGQKVATGDVLTYDSVPSKALYLLKDLTRGKEERIFTYEGGEQIWW